MRSLVWFRDGDLRLADHQPLAAAAASVGEVIPLFCLEPAVLSPHAARDRPHRVQFILESLQDLHDQLVELGSQLIVVEGPSAKVIPELVAAWSIDRVFAHSFVDPSEREREHSLSIALGAKLQLFDGELLLRGGTVRSGSNSPYSVFGPFAKQVRERAALIVKPLPRPIALPPVQASIGARSLPIPTCDSLSVPHNPQIVRGGEAAGRKRLGQFLKNGLRHYAALRDRMDLSGTSRIAPDLASGTLSIREVWSSAIEAGGRDGDGWTFLNELLWREFAKHILWNRPQVLEEPFRTDFRRFPWRTDEDTWHAWAEGRTGYPLVDAAARQLLADGFVHNRARMIAASFLTKHLLIDYRRGEAHYWRYLTDGDRANNNLGWQWSAGCGCDAQPYFRVFNPVLQGKSFDPEGDYVRRWVPELSALPARFIHRPWDAGDSVCAEAGVKLGATYPQPIVEHRLARQRFLDLATRHLRRTS